MKCLKGTALVTGGGSGIGQRIAIACARYGCTAVAIADINRTSLEETERQLRATSPDVKVVSLVVDVSDMNSVKDMVTATIQAFNRLDYAFNSAGISVTARVPAVEYPLAEYDDIQAINARGLLLCVQAEIQAMLGQEPMISIESHDPLRGQRGSVVNIASVCGSQVIPSMLPYTASKHAVIGITKSTAIDHASQRIRINAVCPGLVETPMITTRRQQTQERESTTASKHSDRFIPADIYNTPLERLALADEIADAAVFLASTLSSHITASCITVDGGRSASY